MNEMSVRMLRLEPMEVATFHAFGPAPEAEAWRKLQTWSQPRRRLGRNHSTGYSASTIRTPRLEVRITDMNSGLKPAMRTGSPTHRSSLNGLAVASMR